MSAARAARSALHRGVLGVTGGEARLEVHAGHAEEEEVGGDVLRGLDRRRATSDRRVLEQTATEYEHLGARMVEQGGGNRRAVSDHGAVQVLGERVDDGQRGRAAVEDHHAAGPHQPGRRRGDLPFAVRGHGPPGAVVRHGGRNGKRPAVDPLAQPLARQVAQVAPHGVLGNPQLGGDILATILPCRASRPSRWSRRSAASIRILSCSCTFLHVL